MTAPLYPLQFEDVIRRALVEDLGGAGDLTTDAIIPLRMRAEAEVVARENGRVAGLTAATYAFTLLDPAAKVEIRICDGEDAEAGATLALVSGRARALLSAERVALNVLGRLCGIATETRGIVRSLEGLKTRVVCTRKTTPGLRLLEKYAVRMGGGTNHRWGLDDAVLVKDNHRVVAGSITAAVARVRQAVGHMVKVAAEADTLADVKEAVAAEVDVVLLDNMPLEMLREAVALVDGRVVVEASGGITPETARSIAETGVDLISVGWLTHSAPALDVALDVVPAAS
jgi:nicotinate-nucleotide pyrophosphorylase (carboxylating)